MAYFRLRREAEHWFKHIRNSNGISLDFDSYYYCFMAGLATGQKNDMKGEDSRSQSEKPKDLVDNFPDRYKPMGKILVALFLRQEIAQMGVSLDCRDEVYQVVQNLIQPDSPSFLTDQGVKEFNKYAFAGYDVLTEWFPDQPRELDTFLRTFKRKIDEVATNFPKALPISI